MRRAVLGAAAALAVAAAPAWAQDRPITSPTRDVDVTYRAGPAAEPIEQRSRFRAADRMLRLDTPTPGIYIIANQQDHTMVMVSDADRGAVELPLRRGLPGSVDPGQAFVRRGVDQVAGLPCTEWETLDSQHQPTLACFTADGVLLRARRGAQVLVVATKVTYGPLDPAVFTVPPEYRRIPARGGE